MPVNSQTGQKYTVQKAPGGAWHIYPNGRRVFVRAGAPHAQSPVQAAPAPASAPTQVQVAPDSEYFTGQAQSTFDVAGKLAEVDEDQRIDRSNYDEALRRMADNQKQSTKNATEGRNRQGLYYSGILGQDLADSAKEYARQRADALQGLNARETARANARRALQSGATIDEAAAYAGAGDRQIGRYQDAADSNSLVANPGSQAASVPAVPTVKPAAPAIRKPKPYRVVTARNKVFHTYKSGRRVAVRRTSR